MSIAETLKELQVKFYTVKLYKVGGCVRDELLGVKSKDIDYSVVIEDKNNQTEIISGEKEAVEKAEEWLSNKSSKISDAVKKRGGHAGKNNPMFGKSHSDKSLKLLTERANTRDPNCYVDATETKIARGLAIPKEQKTEWELYREQVLNHTYKSWKHHQNKINPLGLERGSEYELDHKFSITEGFKQNVGPEVIGHYSNLELLPKDDNRSKRIKCSITLEELIRLQSGIV